MYLIMNVESLIMDTQIEFEDITLSDIANNYYFELNYRYRSIIITYKSKFRALKINNSIFDRFYNEKPIDELISFLNKIFIGNHEPSIITVESIKKLSSELNNDQYLELMKYFEKQAFEKS